MIARAAGSTRAEMEKTFNMGVGMVAVVPPEDIDRALAILTARHLDCWVLGTVKQGRKGARAPHWWGITRGSETRSDPTGACRRRRPEHHRLRSVAVHAGVGATVHPRPGQLPLKPLEVGLRELYLSSRATLVCFALARPWPMGEPPRAITERPKE